jgi:hypothetical protein
MRIFDYKDIAIVNKNASGFAIYPDKSIIITNDFIKNKNSEDTSTIYIGESIVEVSSNNILLGSFESRLPQNESYSTVYGERLVEIIRWIINVLKTHSHGPNSPAIPNFHSKADEILRNMNTSLLNNKVRTR